jgi:hypothetical protein
MERGINRISAGWLNRIARALNVDIAYLFEGIEPGVTGEGALIPRRLLMLDLARSFVAIPVPRHQDSILLLARALAEPHPTGERVRHRVD